MTFIHNYKLHTLYIIIHIIVNNKIIMFKIHILLLPTNYKIESLR